MWNLLIQKQQIELFPVKVVQSESMTGFSEMVVAASAIACLRILIRSS